MWIETQWNRYADYEAIGEVIFKETSDECLLIARTKGYITLGTFANRKRAEQVWESIKEKRRSSPSMVRVPKK